MNTASKTSLKLRYAGNLATDDFLWIVEGTAKDLIEMITSPRKWVRNVKNLQGWPKTQHGHPFPKPRLKKHFHMRFSEFKGATGASSANVVIQGISGTGMITAFASNVSIGTLYVAYAQQFLNAAEPGPASQFAERALRERVGDGYTEQNHRDFLNHIRQDRQIDASGDFPLNVNVDSSNSHFYGHLCIYNPESKFLSSLDPVARASIRALTVALYLCGNASYPNVYVEFLSCLDCAQRTISPDGSICESEGHFHVGRPPVTEGLKISLGSGIQFIYAGTDGADEEICDVVDGLSDDSGTDGGILSTSTVKSYSPIPGMKGLHSPDYEVVIQSMARRHVESNLGPESTS